MFIHSNVSFIGLDSLSDPTIHRVAPPGLRLKREERVAPLPYQRHSSPATPDRAETHLYLRPAKQSLGQVTVRWPASAGVS